MLGKKILFKSLLLIISITFIIFPFKDVRKIVNFKPVELKNLVNVNIHTTARGEKIYKIADLTYQDNSNPMTTDLVFSFNQPLTKRSKDDSGKYNIKYLDYIFTREKNPHGNGCGKFFKRTHRVEFETVENLWLGSCGDLGSFAIEFRFLPFNLKDNSILFSRVGYFSGKKRGIEIILKNKRVYAKFYGLFEKSPGVRIDQFLTGGEILKARRWYHFILSFDRMSGKLAKYLNGNEDELVYMTENREPFNGVYLPTFGGRDKNNRLACLDSPGAVIGKNFTGLIDEFRISYRHFNDLEKETDLAYKKYRKLGMIKRIPVNIEGIIQSPVYNFQDTGTRVTLFKWKEILPKNTFIWVEFRIYDRLFKEDNTDLIWYRIKNNQRKIYLKKISSGDFLRGKYYQWRAHLVPSPGGKDSPIFYGIQLHYNYDLPPVSPKFPEIVEEGDEFIRVKWKKNIEPDILGYKIYYGVNQNKYDGIITRLNGKRITNQLNNNNYIEIKVSNKLINENMKRDKRKLHLFPVIRNNVLYFFSISAYDSYKPDTSFNHESKLSKQISGRPFPGSEID